MSSPPGQKPNDWQPLESDHRNGEQFTVGSALQGAFQKLKSTSDTALLDSQVLLGFILSQTRAWVVSHPEQPLSREESSRYRSSVDWLFAGVPLAHILGKWEFFGLEFKVTPDVLIPRPETELLVEIGLEWLHSRPGRRQAVDVGTGSGCIAIALASRVPDLTVIASDLSAKALLVARQNIVQHHLLPRILPIQADLLPPVRIRFDLICANLPYIPIQSLEKLPVSRYEPKLALDGGQDGLQVIKRLLSSARPSLEPGACILLEIESGQGDLVPATAQGYFPEAQVTLQQDLAGQNRVVTIQLPENSPESQEFSS